jgi:hypothetical protein
MTQLDDRTMANLDVVLEEVAVPYLTAVSTN